MRWTTVVMWIAALVLTVTTPTVRLAAGQTIPAGSPAVIEGTVSVVVEDDFAKGRATKRYFLDQPGPHGRNELKLTSHQAKSIQPGMKVRVTGSLAASVLSADPVDAGVVVLEAPAATAPAAARKVLVLLVDIVDSKKVTHGISSTCDDSSETAAAIAFGFNTTAASVDGCYQDSSFGQLGMGGASYPGTDVDVQRVSISDSVTSCNYTSWGSKADAKASNLSHYEHRVYVVPADVNCDWAGLAYVSSCPGTYCQAWVKAYGSQPCGYIDAIAHEVGHNIGLMHSSWDTNNDGSIDCEYCDDSDFMGYAEATLRPLNGPHRVQMGWVSGTGIVDASGGGQFTLSPLNQPDAPLPQVATIVPSTGSPYYVSYRTVTGYDSFLAYAYYSSAVLGEISIHRWPGGISNTLFITSLADGQVFTDEANSLTIAQNSHSDGSTTLTVYISILAPKNLNATPGDSQVALSWSASSGATGGYNVKRATVSGGPYTTVAPGVSGTAYVDTQVVNGQTYYYVVSALKGTDESPDSAQVSATPNGVDLVETAVGNPPTVAAPGGSFSVSDTVKNNGLVTAGASTTQYYLSADQQKDVSDVPPGGSRLVPSLAAGQTSNGNATVTIPSTMLSGTYYLLVCADDLNAVTETNETNNCRASATTVQVTRPDLVVTVVGNPTSPVGAGGTLKVTDTVKNQGTAAAGAFTVGYYLSADQQKNAGDLPLGSRSVSSLSAGQTSNGNLTTTVPSTTPPGTYYVLSCADDSSTVSETNESNNCRASATTVQVTLPDLVITAVTNPPATAAGGGTFRVTDTVKNLGTVTAGATTVRYYLSSDPQKGGGDVLLGGFRSVSSLTAGKTSSGNVTVTIPAGTLAGTYYLLACADDQNVVVELNETNNCLSSAGTVIVH